jgi:site-specific DNA recombinase
MKPSETNIMRCAIYTRKSSEEGLDQSFNSLDAQGRLARPSSAARNMRAGGR